MTAVVEPFRLPFTVLVDTAEGSPWTFDNILADADQDYRPLVVPWEYQSLGRFPLSRGDYSIQGFQHRIGIERKSIEDFHSTFLGWQTKFEQSRGRAGHRQRFEKELENLAAMEVGVVIVEANMDQVLDEAPATEHKSAEENRKTLHRSIISFQQTYKVPFSFCSSRRFAETHCLQHMIRFWRKHKKEFKAFTKLPYI